MTASPRPAVNAPGAELPATVLGMPVRATFYGLPADDFECVVYEYAYTGRVAHVSRRVVKRAAP